MSEYIKKVDLLAKAVEVEYLGRPRLMVSVAQIGNTPAIDVVRCKDCKWCMTLTYPSGTLEDICECQTKDVEYDDPYCGSWQIVKPDDFCSYGEVRDE